MKQSKRQKRLSEKKKYTIQPKSSRTKYRLVFVLEDGRKVYVTDNGKLAKVTSKLAEKFKGQKLGAYTSNLSAYYNSIAIKSLSKKYANTLVKVVSFSAEPTTAKIDETAFVLGGHNVVDFMEGLK